METGSVIVQQLVADLQAAIVAFKNLPPEQQVDTNPTQESFLEDARSLAEQFRSDAHDFIENCRS